MSEDSANQASSGRDVFVSYASQDVSVANSVVEALEGHGIKCWIAPRDVKPGAQYADAIVRAINEAKTLVLVLSQSAVGSSHIGKEVERASSKGKQIIALRIDVAPLTPALEYFLSESQWVDAPALGMPAALGRLSESIGQASAPSSNAVGAAGTNAVNPVTLTGRRSSRVSTRVVVAAVVLVGVAIAVGIGIHFWPMKGQTQAVVAISDKSIAVLPFTDMSQKKDQEYFGDGMAEEILDLLAKIPGLTVIGRTSSFQFKGKSEDLRKIGTELNAAYVLEGSVRNSGDQVRITAQLVNTKTGAHLWSEKYDRDFGDVLVLQDEIATGIARALQLAVGADDLRPARRLSSTEAYTLYLHARGALDRLDESMDVARSELEQALVLDPSFVQAAEVLALMHAEQALNQWVSGPTGWQDAREAAETALHIDPASARAHAVLGLVIAEQEFRWHEADAELAQALQTNPHDSFALDFVARLAMHRGRFDEALHRIDTALSLDPLNPYAYDTKGTIQYLAGDLRGAERALRRVNELSPTFYGARLEVGWVLMARGDLNGALKELLAETSNNGRDAGLASIYHALGRKTDSDAALARLRKEVGNWPSGVALAHASRGERDQALDWLEKAYVARDPDLLLWGPVHPFFALLHGDPRYTALLHKMNLPE
jgi:TolB-like protein/Flp pilus assembly protein TadD